MDKYQRYVNKLNQLYKQLKNTTVSGLSDRLGSSEIKISQLESNYQELQTNYENLQSNYQELQTNYENLQSNCHELQEQLTNHINTPTE